ncbi:MAG: 6,7-dimethyl-8-ribityllumazine synthase [Pseudomonadota bacterium]
MAEHSDAGQLPLPDLVPAPRVLIVAAPYYRAIADGLIAGARAALARAGAGVELIEVPGALEVAPAIRLAADGRGFEGYVAIGCVIRGETTHYETVCEESARGLTLLGVDRGLAIGNAILTVENQRQAELRADPAGQNKGGGAAEACLHLIALARRFRGGVIQSTPSGLQGATMLASAGASAPGAEGEGTV